MKKLLIILLVALTLMSISAVSAVDNQTQSDFVSLDEIDSEPVRANTTISAKPVTGYETFQTEFTVNLTSDGEKLTGMPVKITVNDVDYDKNTDDKGLVVLKLKLKEGSYIASYSFAGNENYSPSNGTAKITVKAPAATVLKQADSNINYRQGSKTVFIVRLTKTYPAAVKYQNVTITVNGKTYKAQTDSKGYAQIFLNLKKGTYTVKYSFKGNSPYLASSGSCKIKVKESIPKGDGYWMWAGGMKTVNLKTLKAKGTKHIFLNSYAIDLYGRSAVQSWIAKANKQGIKVHIWMQVFYDGKWVRPVNKDGSLKYDYMNKKISKAKYYSKIKGVAGVHFDYLRFGGTAHYYDTSTKAINYFAKKASVEIRKSKPNCIISAAIMPEPTMMEYYYGQDVPTMSKYLDVIIPMVYKGNYAKNTAWIKSVTSTFVKQSNGAQIWTGLQAYKSDSNVKKLSHSELLKDAKAAKAGGAKGVVLFRIGVTNLLNFKAV
ncbi:putative glycoside hydrolase [uncultured Methanobrevibacter sp.]|uniref:putative glycoside hydrolase n=1 Tax=uncultured Methanobrevibacter sp. TaxID=253161 RepID=UPI002606B27D|nr:putative glycoside hydrolase [uncultured Methanobrevibacter sp.]